MQIHQLPHTFLSSQVIYFSTVVEINSHGTGDQQNPIYPEYPLNGFDVTLCKGNNSKLSAEELYAHNSVYVGF